MNENINVHDNYPDSEQTINVPSMKVAPLKKICMTIGELPTSYLETMTYYEMVVWFIHFLRDTVIPTVNENAEAVQEVQNVVMDLQTYINNFKDSIDQDVEDLEDYMNNYFNNLDVQEEINNKLDQMLEDGQLEQIIEQFLQLTSLIAFDNVQGMKDSTNLANGSFAQTLGFYSKNDGGKALYKVRTITNDDVVNERNIIALYDDSLIAELIEDEKGVINALQWGAVADGETDNTNAFNDMIDYANTNRMNIFIPKGDYVIEDDLDDIVAPISIYGNVSGEGQYELKSTIIDKRTSINALFNIDTKSTTDGIQNQGGTIKYINFRNVENLFKNKCINLVNTECYHGTIENCHFYQYGTALRLERTHGINVDKCAFVKCGSDTANSTDYAIYITDTVDCSISNSMIDHTRYQLYVDLASYVTVTNTHFELSTINIVAGNSPIYCNVGIYGHVSFTGCIFIGLSYKFWAEQLSITPASVPFMIFGTYVTIDNSILSCGSGSGSYHTNYGKQCKFANLYYGTISDCKIKSPSYLVNAFTLTQGKIVNSHIQCDLEPTDYNSIVRNSRIIYSSRNYSKNNFLQFIVPTTDPQTYPTIYPVLYNYYSDLTPVETNKGEIFFDSIVENAKLTNYNTLKLQSNGSLTGLYTIRAYSTGQTQLIYEGHFRISNKYLVKVDEVYKSFGADKKIVVYTDDNSNDVYIQFLMTTTKTNNLVVTIEGLECHSDVLCYYVPSINEALTFTNSLDLSA